MAAINSTLHNLHQRQGYFVQHSFLERKQLDGKVTDKKFSTKARLQSIPLSTKSKVRIRQRKYRNIKVIVKVP